MPRFALICLTCLVLKMFNLIFYKYKLIDFEKVKRLTSLVVIFGINACYLNGNGFVNPTLVWLPAIPVFVITLYGVKDGAWWSLSSVALSILIFEYSYRIGHNINEYNDELTYITMQSNLFTAPLLLYMMFGFYSYNRVQLQERIQEQAAQLELEKKEKEKLLTLLFHDLGRNISLLSGYIDINKKEPGNISSKEKIYSLTEELKTILKTTSELDLNRNDVSVVEELRLFDIYTGLKLQFENEFQKKSLEFIFEGDRELSIKAVKSHLHHHILGNIISNAIKFSHKNGVISFKVKKTMNEVTLMITNRGIHYEEQVRLGTEGEPGNGQGLKIVKEFAQKNNLNFSMCTDDNMTFATLKKSLIC